MFDSYFKCTYKTVIQNPNKNFKLLVLKHFNCLLLFIITSSISSSWEPVKQSETQRIITLKFKHNKSLIFCFTIKFKTSIKISFKYLSYKYKYLI